MRLLVQRVTEASVSVNGEMISSIGKGLLVLCGIGREDSEEDLERMAAKLSALRLFQDEQGLMNLNAAQAETEFLLISQFTLYASTKKGNRPSFLDAAPPIQASVLFNRFEECMRHRFPHKIKSGVFGANMQVHLINDGPVTIFMDSAALR